METKAAPSGKRTLSSRDGRKPVSSNGQVGRTAIDVDAPALIHCSNGSVRCGGDIANGLCPRESLATLDNAPAAWTGKMPLARVP